MRPKLHFTPLKNWCNDPNGLCYFNGEYHLYYQYFPYGLKWGTMHWGHASTTDFLTYQHHDIAIFPSIDADMNGAFSGTAFVENDQLNFYYTGVKYLDYNPKNIHVPSFDNNFKATQILLSTDNAYQLDPNKKQVLAFSTDIENNHQTHTRDPKVWKENGKYYLLIVSKLESENCEQGKLNIYQSDNLIDFKFFTAYTRENYGNMWECPDYFKLANQAFIIMSPENFFANKLYPSQATIQKAEFNIEQKQLNLALDYQLIDYGLDFYAPQTFSDADNNRVMIGWLRMPKAFSEKQNKYIGMMTMPRIITYEQGMIKYNVHPLIKDKFIYQNNMFSINKPNLIKIKLKRYESINIGGYQFEFNQCLKTSRENNFPNQEAFICKTPEIKQEIINLEIYLDGNVIETFVNDGQYVITNIVYNLTDVIKTNGIDFELLTMEPNN